MLKLKVSQLKENMVFSKPLYTVESELVIYNNNPLKKTHIDRIKQKGIFLVYTFGEILNKGDDEKSALDMIRNELSSTKKEESSNSKDQFQDHLDEMDFDASGGSGYIEIGAPSKKEFNVDDLEKAKRYEYKINIFEIYESFIEAYTLSLTNFIRSSQNERDFSMDILKLSNRMIKHLKDDPYTLLELIGYVEVGNNFVSHSVNVTIITIVLGMHLNIAFKRLQNISIGALLHDIGKVVYFKINTREGIQVSREEMNLNLSHPVYSYKTCRDILRLPEECCQAALNHHEQADGKGFPRRVDGNRLSIADKVLFLANLLGNLMTKNLQNGTILPIKQILHLHTLYKDKFDNSLIKRLEEILKELERRAEQHTGLPSIQLEDTLKSA